MYSIEDYDFNLPAELIAQNPADKRDESRLFHLNRKAEKFSHLKFADITDLLSENDLLVVNNTKVIPARLFGTKKTGGKVEILILEYLKGIENLNKTGFFESLCLLKSSRRPKPGSEIKINDNLYAEVQDLNGKYAGLRFVSSTDVLKEIDKAGNLPLPPYIKRENNENTKNDRIRYQTVYAKNDGAVAAPTAGLHFTDELISQLKKKGVSFAEITLYVGYGTFSPVECEDIRDHEIHTEKFYIEQSEAEKINTAVKDGKRVVAVGTTSVRTLEYASDKKGFIKPGAGQCNLFIYPGYRFKIVKSLITNFHLPKSTLLMLISAFSDIEIVKKAYAEAVQQGYRFFSYGDSMFIE
ncbi:MAG: tRNA preQ1(34) S-adenosylmethionine ribosyltransferase-isomerase QueA [Thermodesulfobacteriota bacterium]